MELENKYIVLKSDSIDKLSPEYKNLYWLIIQEIWKIQPSSETNKYLVVNQDEPYAEEVLALIRKYENFKEETVNDKIDVTACDNYVSEGLCNLCESNCNHYQSGYCRSSYLLEKDLKQQLEASRKEYASLLGRANNVQNDLIEAQEEVEELKNICNNCKDDCKYCGRCLYMLQKIREFEERESNTIQENTVLKARIEELTTSFENERQNLHTKNKLLTNDKMEALKTENDRMRGVLEKIADDLDCHDCVVIAKKALSNSPTD